jgi:signal recognition particle subunit SRP19
MAHPRIEEISDSDSDPDIMDPSTLARSALRPQPSNSSSHPPPRPAASTSAAAAASSAGLPASAKSWHLLYPLYFDAAASRAGGRRVSAGLAVACPLAHSIADAIARMGLASVFEPGKTHPRDWANPGRVRVQLRAEDGRWVAGPAVKNSELMLFLLFSSGEAVLQLFLSPRVS